MDLFCDAHETARRYGRYVEDVRRLFVFHGLSCGRAEDFGRMAAKLEESTAFRADVAALARSVAELERGEMSAKQMLTVLAMASAGEAVLDAGGAVGVSRTTAMLGMLLAGVGTWRESADVAALGEGSGPELWAGAPSEPRWIAAEELSDDSDPVWRTGSGEAAAVPSEGTAEDLAVDGSGRRAEGPGVAQELWTDRGGLASAIAALQAHLDGLDRRIERLEPRVDGITHRLRTPGEEVARPSDRDGDAATHGAGADGSNAVAQPDQQRRAAGIFGRGMAIATAEAAIAEGMPPVERDGEELGGAGLSDAGREAEEGGGCETGLIAAAPVSMEEAAAEPEMRPQRYTASKLIGDISSTGDGEGEALSREAEEGHLFTAVLRRRDGAGREPDAAEGKGSHGMSPKRQERSTRERVGRWLGIAAVLLAIVGIIGLRTSFRLPGGSGGMEGKETAATGVSKGSTMPAPAAAGAAGLPKGSAPAVSQPTVAKVDAGRDDDAADAARGVDKQVEPGSAQDGAPKKSGTDARVAGKRLEMARTEPRTEEPGSVAGPKHPDEGSIPKTQPAPDVVERAREGVANDASGKDKGPVAVADADSRSASGPVLVSQEAMEKRLLSTRKPVYPPGALEQHAEGRVVLNAFIAKDGTVRRMDVVEGPPALIHSALAAVSWRRYRPYLVQGRPVEVETQITVQYPGR